MHFAVKSLSAVALAVSLGASFAADPIKIGVQGPFTGGLQAWQVYCPNGTLDGGCPGVPHQTSYCNGLFQLMTVDPGLLDGLWGSVPGGTLNLSHGVYVEQPWRAPPNYFNVDFNTMFNTSTREPVVHVSVAIHSFGGAQAAIWPDPTPKFQVRTYP